VRLICGDKHLRDEILPSLSDNKNDIIMYIRLKIVENPSQIPRAER